MVYFTAQNFSLAENVILRIPGSEQEIKKALLGVLNYPNTKPLHQKGTSDDPEKNFSHHKSMQRLKEGTRRTLPQSSHNRFSHFWYTDHGIMCNTINSLQSSPFFPLLVPGRSHLLQTPHTSDLKKKGDLKIDQIKNQIEVGRVLPLYGHTIYFFYHDLHTASFKCTVIAEGVSVTAQCFPQKIGK